MRLLLPLVALFLLSNVARGWVAEWIYPLDESSLWAQPSYGNLREEVNRIQIARRFAHPDPRYAYRLTRLYQEAMAQGLLDPSSKERVVAEAKLDFEVAIRSRPVFAVYLAWYALFLHTVGDPSYLSQEKVGQALFLGRQDLDIRAFVATFYQYYGRRQRALELWHSILIEDPSRTREVVETCFDYYQDYSFLLEIAPEEKLESLVRFQASLFTFQPQGEAEKLYLKILPLLIERSERTENETPLLEVIARTYEQAEDYRLASFWYERAFRSAETPESRALLLLKHIEILSRQGRLMEAYEFLKGHLNLSSIRSDILVSLANISWPLGKREEAIEAMRRAVDQKEAPFEWRDQFAFFLYEEGRFKEAAKEWRTLLQASQGTPYESANEQRIRQRIQACERELQKSYRGTLW